jgi:hypothetical protein
VERLAGMVKHGSINRPALVTITGFPEEASTQAVSCGEVSIEASSDPVGAPIFFRDVPLFGSTEAGTASLPMAVGSSFLPKAVRCIRNCS